MSIVWSIKQFAKLSNVSIKTLHHYDSIGLLKPSIRRLNKYRGYSEENLSKLQKIIALKTFGFKLEQINALLEKDIDLSLHLKAQASFLKKEAKKLNLLSKDLDKIVKENSDNTNIPWTTIINIIQRYKNMEMNKKNSWLKENPWAETVFSKQELTALEKANESLQHVSDSQWIQYSRDWALLSAEVEKVISENPYGEIGQKYAKKWLNLAHKYYTDEVALILWNALKENRLPEHVGITDIPKEVIEWINKAIDHLKSNES